MTDERIDDDLRKGFASLRLSPERLAALQAQASPRRGRWQAAMVAVAAVAVMALAAAPFLGRTVDSSGDPAGATAPAPVQVGADQRAVSLEVGVDALWPEVVRVGGHVDIAAVLSREGSLNVLVIGERLEVVGLSPADGSLLLASSPAMAEQLVPASQQGALVPLADLGRGRRGVPLQVDALPLRTGLVTEGSRIDVLLTEAREGSMRTVTVGSDVEVLAVDADNGRLLVQAPAEGSPALVLAEHTGALTVTLRGR